MINEICKIINTRTVFIIIMLLLVLIVETVSVIYTYKTLQQQDQEILNLKMNFVIKGVLRQTRGRIRQIQYTVSRPTAFFRRIGKNVSRTSYHEILQMDKNPLLTSIETIVWLPKIYYDEKEWYENYIKSVDDVNFTICEYNLSDKKIYPVNKRDFYFPYTYSEPPNAILDSRLYGFDFYSNPLTKILIDHALSNVNSTGTFRTQLINNTENPHSYGIILNELTFVNLKNITVDNIVGIFMALINVGDIMTISINNLDIVIDRNDIDVMIFDITKDNIANNKSLNMSLLYKELKSEYDNIWFSEDIPNYSYKFVENVNINDRVWNINFRFLDSFITKNTSNNNIYIITSISVALFFFDIILYILTYQKYKESEKKQLANNMLGYVNHEIRNPLNVVIGMIDIIITTLSNKIQKNNDTTSLPNDEIHSIISDLHTAESSCHMLRHIVNDILDIRKLEENKLEINNNYIRLDKFCKHINKTITPKILEKLDLKFSIKINDNLGNKMICVDNIRLEQILLNFIFNSIKFTVNGSITLNIKQKHHLIVFEVIDTGRGISEESKKVIFQPFRQTKKDDATRYGGIGLGLYLCKMLATCMGGTIGFNSQLGKGSTFFIELPLKIKYVDEKNLSITEEEKNLSTIEIIDDYDNDATSQKPICQN